MSQVNTSSTSSSSLPITINAGSGISVTGSPVSPGGSVTISATGSTSTAAYFESHLSNNITYTVGAILVACDVIDSNTMSFYDATTFTATAPVSGFYVFSANIAFSLIPSPETAIELRNITSGINRRTNVFYPVSTGGTGVNYATSCCWMLSLNAGDQIQVYYLNPGFSPTAQVIAEGAGGSTYFTSFSGSLLA
jgi:hypothetical protein